MMRLRQILLAPIPIGQLVIFRVLFGGIMFWEVTRYFQHGWIEKYYIEPQFHFSYYLFDWVQPWPGDGMIWHFYLLGGLALLIMAGCCYRLSMAAFFVAFSYVFLLEEARYLNHLYLVCLISFLMIFIPAHRAISVDAWWRPGLQTNDVPAWSLWLLRFQIGLVYFFGGIAKINGDWLQGEPMRMWLAERTDFPLIGQWFTEEWLVYLFAYGGLLFDLLFVPLVFYPRTRPLILLISVFFHLTNDTLFVIGIFPWFMLGANVLFLPSRWFGAATPPAETVKPLTTYQKLLFAVLGLYCLFQVLFPLRHWLYPGEVHWTEEGHRFAWHMKLRDKSGFAEFFVIDPDTNGVAIIDLNDYLLPHQRSAMVTRPDMLLEFSHYLAEQFRAQGYMDFDIRVRARISLNGRPPQLMIDTAVNLAEQPRSWRPGKWILPLESRDN